MKIHPVGAQFIRADKRMNGRTETDRQTNVTQLIAAFSQFCERASNDATHSTGDGKITKALENIAIKVFVLAALKEHQL